MRSEETFVLEKLTASVGGTFRDGEDPPDAYIDLPGRVVSVEVTRLIEPMLEGSTGVGQSRLGGDSPADRMMSELVSKFEMRVPAGKSMLIMVSTPINNLRKLRSEIERHVDEVVELGYANRIINLGGDGACITIYDEAGENEQSIQYMISNEGVSADIGENLTHSLAERMEAKVDLPSRCHTGDEYWLCILSEIWLASAHSIQLAFDELESDHNYDKVYVIHAHGEVQQLT